MLQMVDVALFIIEIFAASSLIYMAIKIRGRLTRDEGRADGGDFKLPLSSDEVRVLTYLLSKDRPVVQSTIGRDLNIPKSTLFRIVRRLNELGLVTVEKRGKYNYVYIQRVDEVRKILSSYGK